MQEHKDTVSLWRYICLKSNNAGETLLLSRGASLRPSPCQATPCTAWGASPLQPGAAASPLCSSFRPAIVSLFINSVTQRFPALLRISVIDSSRCHLRASSKQIPGPCVGIRELHLSLEERQRRTPAGPGPQAGEAPHLPAAAVLGRAPGQAGGHRALSLRAASGRPSPGSGKRPCRSEAALTPHGQAGGKRRPRFLGQGSGLSRAGSGVLASLGGAALPFPGQAIAPYALPSFPPPAGGAEPR